MLTKYPFTPKSLYQASIFASLLVSPNLQAQTPPKKESDAHIRQIVESLLQEKDKTIAKLEARIQQLENKLPSAKPSLADTAAKQTDNLPKAAKESSKAPSTTAAASVDTKTATSASAPADTSFTHKVTSQLNDLGEEVASLKEAAQKKGLGIRGFFDVNAKTDNSTDQTFSVGSIELDLEYSYNDNFAASSAIVLCGNSSGTDYAAPAAITCGGSGPGGIGAGGAGFSVAVIDFHMFDGSIPPRGRIFNNQGFHIQAGRFDLPFSSDYQYYANTDRVTVTAPITTSKMQFGGFNGDGVRSYGSWKMLNYSVFWTDAMYANDGTSLGGRVGLQLGQNQFRSHRKDFEGVELGFSHLSDLDKNRNLRHTVYGADLSLGYGFLKLQNELMLLQTMDNFIDEDGTDYGKAHELGYHTTLIADLESFISHPVLAFVRYGRWQPKQTMALDYDGKLVGVDDVSLLTVGVNYRFNDYFKMKFEYTDSLGTSTQERYFDRTLGIAQAVVSF